MEWEEREGEVVEKTDEQGERVGRERGLDREEVDRVGVQGGGGGRDRRPVWGRGEACVVSL